MVEVGREEEERGQRGQQQANQLPAMQRGRLPPSLQLDDLTLLRKRGNSFKFDKGRRGCI